MRAIPLLRKSHPCNQQPFLPGSEAESNPDTALCLSRMAGKVSAWRKSFYFCRARRCYTGVWVLWDLLTKVTASVEQRLPAALNSRFSGGNFCKSVALGAGGTPESPGTQDPKLALCYASVCLCRKSALVHKAVIQRSWVRFSCLLPCHWLLSRLGVFLLAHGWGVTVTCTWWAVQSTGKCPRTPLLALPLHSLEQAAYFLVKFK